MTSDDMPSGLDPDPETMRKLGYRAVDLAVAHLRDLREKPVARPPHPETLRAVVDEPLPLEGRGLEDCLARTFDLLMPHATLVNHPRFLAYVPGPGSFAGALGAFVAAATNTFCGTYLGGAVMTELEVKVLDWLRRGMALPPAFEGVLTSGGSLANLGALAAARAWGVQSKAGGDAAAWRRFVLYTSDEAHYAVTKAARVLGFADDRVRVLPTDAEQCLTAEVLAPAVAADAAARLVPLAVCATFGTTSTGAIDPLAPLAEVCRRHDLWLHVDGAWGAAVALLPEERAEGGRAEALHHADSLVLDPHKGLYTPFESGCLLTRRIEALHAAFAADGAYLQDIPRDEVNFFERGPELSRGNRALKLWMLLRGIGLEAVREALRRDLTLCRLAHDLLLADPRVEIVTPPRLSVFTFAVRGASDDDHLALMQALLADGRVMLSTSRVRGRVVLRLCVANHRTTEADMRTAVDTIRAHLPS